jgi:hypothetical protein
MEFGPSHPLYLSLLLVVITIVCGVRFVVDREVRAWVRRRWHQRSKW